MPSLSFHFHISFIFLPPLLLLHPSWPPPPIPLPVAETLKIKLSTAKSHFPCPECSKFGLSHLLPTPSAPLSIAESRKTRLSTTISHYFDAESREIRLSHFFAPISHLYQWLKVGKSDSHSRKLTNLTLRVAISDSRKASTTHSTYSATKIHFRIPRITLDNIRKGRSKSQKPASETALIFISLPPRTHNSASRYLEFGHTRSLLTRPHP
ncbi:hypothetical protein SAMN05518855_1001655 [Paenibacillus sp. CF384]|nr:hypothetical protein SAMN05518855_1001655 [Paenibacillus sp. CF384]